MSLLLTLLTAAVQTACTATRIVQQPILISAGRRRRRLSEIAPAQAVKVVAQRRAPKIEQSDRCAQFVPALGGRNGLCAGAYELTGWKGLGPLRVLAV